MSAHEAIVAQEQTEPTEFGNFLQTARHRLWTHIYCPGRLFWKNRYRIRTFHIIKRCAPPLVFVKQFMHELGIITNLFTFIEEIAVEHHLAKINRVKLKLGQMQQVVPESLIFAFETVAAGTKAEGARLEIEQAPIKMQCAACSTEFLIEAQSYICPVCSGTRLTMLEGMEIVLESVEGEMFEEH